MKETPATKGGSLILTPHPRPLLLRLAPPRLRLFLYYRFFREKTKRPDFFRDAPLDFAPSLRMDLFEGDEGHGQIAFNGFYELKLSRHLRLLAKQGGLLVDVGANYGYFSLIWAAQNAQNRVIAYEASPRNQPALHINITKNCLSDSITVKPLAAGKKAGVLGFHLGPEEQTGWGGLAFEGPNEKMVDVPVVRLDEELAGEKSIAVLKIDTEGADTWVLEGAEKLFCNKKVRHIFFEEHKGRMVKLGIQPGSAANFLIDCGYTVVRMNGGDQSQVCEYHAFVR